MAGSVNKASIIIEEYGRGSIPQVADILNISRSTVWYHLNAAGVLRSRGEGTRRAGREGRLGSGLRGKTRDFTAAHCEAISSGKLKWADENAAGITLKKNGYLVYTRGPHKGRSVHVIKMEERLGRALRPDECVHHIDGQRAENDDNNLALVTRSGHTRLHIRERRLVKGRC